MGLRLKLTLGKPGGCVTSQRFVAEKSGWAKKKSVKGHGFGIAAHKSFSYLRGDSGRKSK